MKRGITRSDFLKTTGAGLAGATLFGITGCGGGSGQGGIEQGGTQGQKSGRAALIIAQGGLGDDSYNDLANKGFKAALQKTDLEGSPVESDNIVSQGEQVLRRAASSGFDVIVNLEYSTGKAMGSVAKDFPKVSWAIINTEVKGDNIVSVLFQEQQGSFLAGALAAMVTTDPDIPKVNPEQKKIGVIGGTKSVGIDKFIVGYIQGAHHIDPNVQVLTSYAGTFGDPAKGKQLAEAMFEQGADVVYHVAGGTGTGVIRAAKENNRYAIGVDSNQDDVAPGYVLTSMIKRTNVAVKNVLTNYANDEFRGGKTVRLGLKDNGVGLSNFKYTKDQIPKEYLKRVDKLRQKIIDGKIEVWNVAQQGYPDFYSGG